jgi:exonuclease III
MYSIIEGIYVAKKGKFDKPEAEKKYEYLNVLREFNNKLKHHNNKNVIFNLTSIINIHAQTLDCWIQFKYENNKKIRTLPLVKFFQLFFIILG